MKKWLKWVVKQSDLIRGMDFPIDRIIGKSFIAPSKLPHHELLELYEAHGRDGFDWRATAYFRRITQGAASPRASFDALPDALDAEPIWWFMPWACYPAKHRQHLAGAQEDKALEKISGFLDVYESIKQHGYDCRIGGAIRGYLLVHPEWGEIFNQIDGHHRLVVLDFLNKHGLLKNSLVRVFPVRKISREAIFDQPSCRKGLQEGAFTERDALRLFDHPFRQLGFQGDLNP